MHAPLWKPGYPLTSSINVKWRSAIISFICNTLVGCSLFAHVNFFLLAELSSQFYTVLYLPTRRSPLLRKFLPNMTDSYLNAVTVCVRTCVLVCVWARVFWMWTFSPYSPRLGPLTKWLLLFGFAFFGATFADGYVRAHYYVRPPFCWFINSTICRMMVSLLVGITEWKGCKCMEHILSQS